jgi:hypothetical protein
MKKLIVINAVLAVFMSTPVVAADMPFKAPIYPPQMRFFFNPGGGNDKERTRICVRSDLARDLVPK